MNDLLDAVEELTEERLVTIDTDTGTTVARAPARLDVLQDEIRSSMAGGGRSGALKSTRNLLAPDALHRAMTIATQIGDWCRILDVRPTRDAKTDLKAWHVAWIGTPGGGEEFYITQLRKWAREIDGMLDKPKPIDITTPCPVCGERDYVDDQGDVCVWPLKGQADPIRVECRACETVWDGPDAAGELAEEIGASSPTEHHEIR